MLSLLAVTVPLLAAEEFSFDVSSYQKKNFNFGGYLEYSYNRQEINGEAAATTLLDLNSTPIDSLNQHSGVVEVGGDYKKNSWQAKFTFHAEAYDNELQSEQQGQFYEALVAYQPNAGATLEAGKKAIKWGKGYAWNPVGFVERPKDPNDPDLSREGYVVATGDFIRSFSGEVKTLAFTPVYLPVTADINNEYGTTEHNNIAAKLYLLYKDTDIDLVYLGEGSRSQRYGIDFAKNITTNFEVHGEWAYIDEVPRQLVSSSGVVSTDTSDTTRWLLGLRYLTKNDTTIITEYYRNNSGYSATEMTDFFTAVDSAEASHNTALLNTLSLIGQKSYLTRNPGRQYLYFRVSNKEPFDWLYFVPALTMIYNLDDDSYSMSPEFIYTGMQDMEFRFKATLLYGDMNSEFGEKRNERKLELRLRYFY
jgi:hypothetical protein